MGLIGVGAGAQQGIQYGPWRGELLRDDGKTIPFHFDVRTEKNRKVLYIINAGERLRVDKIREIKDSVIIEMPVFESVFRVKKISSKQWEGKWIKGGSVRQQVMPFTARVQSAVPAENIKTPVADITGKWAVTFTKADQLGSPAIGEW